MMVGAVVFLMVLIIIPAYMLGWRDKVREAKARRIEALVWYDMVQSIDEVEYRARVREEHKRACLQREARKVDARIAYHREAKEAIAHINRREIAALLYEDLDREDLYWYR